MTNEIVSQTANNNNTITINNGTITIQPKPTCVRWRGKQFYAVTHPSKRVNIYILGVKFVRIVLNDLQLVFLELNCPSQVITHVKWKEKQFIFFEHEYFRCKVRSQRCECCKNDFFPQIALH